MFERDLRSICDYVLNTILPTPEETQRALDLFKDLSSRLEPLLKELNYPFRISLEGSVSKDTHIRNDTDLDIFVLIRYDGMTKEWLEGLVNKMLEVLSPFKPKRLYASHPYLRFKEDGIEVDVVPAYMAFSVDEIKTAVDRTVFHTAFVKSKLTKEMNNDVRLLKKFFKGIGVYGAEIKTEGFSGYLTELLIIYYGSFIDAVKGIANWKPPQVIDLLKMFEDIRDYLRVFEKKPLIFPDPVDPRRNAAAALSPKSLSTAVLACRRFLERPSINYFYPKTSVGSWDDAEQSINNRRTAVVGYLIIYEEGTSPDVIWGELKKCLRRGQSLLKQFDFEVVDSDLWCDEVSLGVLLYEVVPRELPLYTLHVGPKSFRTEDAGKFLEKYLGVESSVGPWINDLGDLVVMKVRKYLTPYDVLLGEAGKILMARHIRSYEVVKICNLKPIYDSSDEFKVWFYRFISKRPQWLSDTT
ncbi:MAG: CCA tRNA nucleotidyltransferase [Sulfolobales archaeon]